jgi:hypothetical protein
MPTPGQPLPESGQAMGKKFQFPKNQPHPINYPKDTPCSFSPINKNLK